MQINKDNIKDIADLAMLSLSEFEEDKLISDLNQLLETIDTMNNINTDNIEPMSNVSCQENVFRDDLVSNKDLELQLLMRHQKARTDIMWCPRQ